MFCLAGAVKGLTRAPPSRGGHIRQLPVSKNVVTCTSGSQNKSESSSDLGLSYVLYENTSYPADLSPLMLQPGLFARKENFKKLGKQLHHLTNRSLIIPDVRNHGSSPSGAGMSLKQMSGDSLRLIKELGIRTKVSLLGHATGGRVNMVTALRRPNLVDKMVVVSASPLNTEETLSKWAAYRAASAITKQVMAEEGLRDRDLRDSACLEFKLKVDDALKPVFPNNTERALFLSSLGKVNFETISENKDLAIFPEADCVFNGPVLFISGSLAPAWNDDAEVRQCRQLFPNSHFVKIPGAGHWVQIEKEDDFLAVTTSFLQTSH